MTTIPPEHRPDYRDVDAGLCDDEAEEAGDG